MENQKYIDLTENAEKPSIFWQDEILQVMYWMRGEGFGTEITVPNLQKFLQESKDTLETNLAQLEKNGLVKSTFDGKYELTETGILEGGRRFADEFEGMTNQGHYECNDPDCDCKTGEPCLVAEHKH